MSLKTIEIAPTVNSLFDALEDEIIKKYQRQNFFQISGTTFSEKVNSNLLAFYLKKWEEHGFEDLFFKSLLEVIDDKNWSTSMADDDYEVHREYNQIDILIAYRNTDSNEDEEEGGEGYDWAIIIENKIRHGELNDLKSYWNRVKVKNEQNKIGLTISPWGTSEVWRTIKETEEDNAPIITTYKNILHQQIVDKVQELLPQYYLKTDDRHLLYLKDYISNINNMTMTDEQIKKKDARLKAYQDNIEKIEQILQLQQEIKNHALHETIRVMDDLGCKPSSYTYGVKSKYFYIEGYKHYVRFWVNLTKMYRHGLLDLYIETYDVDTSIGQYIRENKKSELENLISKYPNLNPSLGIGGGHCHLAGIVNHPIQKELSEKSFYECLKELLQENFIKNNKGFLQDIELLMTQVKQETQQP